MSTGEQVPDPMQAQPTPEHEWLKRFLGEWSMEMEAQEPGGPVEKLTANEKVRMLGELWTIAESVGDMPGGGISTAITTLGYDPQKGKFVGTWVGSPMTNLWVYEGFLDSSRQILTLESEGPGMDPAAPEVLGKYRDVHEFLDDDHRVLYSETLGPDGTWQRFMEADYRRRD